MNDPENEKNLSEVDENDYEDIKDVGMLFETFLEIYNERYERKRRLFLDIINRHERR